MEDEEEKELILVIEDTANFNDYITQQLKKNGYDIVQCYGIEDASIALSNNYFSLVLLDLNTLFSIGPKIWPGFTKSSSRLRSATAMAYLGPVSVQKRRLIKPTRWILCLPRMM